MCEQCAASMQQHSQHIAGLINAIKLGTPEQWEGSEPFAVGGPAGLYQIRSPFVGEVQWKVDTGICGATAAIVLISSGRHQQNPLLTSADQGTGELSGIDGLLLFLPASNTIPIASEWYNLKDSQGVLYVNITSTTSAAYVNIKFRQKRG